MGLGLKGTLGFYSRVLCGVLWIGFALKGAVGADADRDFFKCLVGFV